MLPIFTRRDFKEATAASMLYGETFGATLFIEEHEEQLTAYLRQFYPDYANPFHPAAFRDNGRLLTLVTAIEDEACRAIEICDMRGILERQAALMTMVENLEKLWDLLRTRFGLTLPEPTAA